MSVYLWLRLGKWIAVTLFVTGSVGAVFARELEERRRFAYRMSGPGLGLTWLLGFLLVAWRGVSILAPWILGTLFLSFVALNVVLYSVGRPGRRSSGSVACLVGTLLGCFWLMVMRPG